VDDDIICSYEKDRKEARMNLTAPLIPSLDVRKPMCRIRRYLYLCSKETPCHAPTVGNARQVRCNERRHVVTARIEERGFTLLELMLVILLAMLILGLTTLFFARTLPSGRLNAAARELSATVRSARALAQISGERQSLVLDLDAGIYGIEGRGEKKLPREITLKVIDPLTGPVEQGTFTMVFDPTGFMSGATLELATTKRAIRIQTDPVVGAVTLK
jgi:general secretion pathway protein H